MSDPVIEQIKKDLASHKVVLYMKGTPEAPQCGFSAATVGILKEYPYPFKAVDVLADPELRARLPEFSNWPTFPQLFVDGKLVGGCDIVHELKESGELQKLLDEAHRH